MNPIDPGQMRTQLVYQEDRGGTLDSYGQPIEAWTDVLTLFARVRPLSAREVFNARQVGLEATHEVTTRYTPAIGAAGRFLVAGTARYLLVAGLVDLEERRAQLVITCIERTPSGEPS